MQSVPGGHETAQRAAELTSGKSSSAPSDPRSSSRGADSGQAPVVTPLRRRRAAPPWSGWAMAASLLVAFAATILVWGLRPSPALAHEVVAHVEGEPGSWGSREPVSGQRLEEILHAAGVELVMDSRRVVYAQSCEFRGHHVPHLVVSTSQGPVTVLVLRYESVTRRQSFHENGMSGVLVPAPHGSIAVLAQGDTNINEVALQMRKDVRWLDNAAQ